jgi:predicted transcriptional regulator
MPVCSKTKKNVEDSENALKRLGLLAAIVRGLEAVQKGRVVSNREAMRRLKKTAFG